MWVAVPAKSHVIHASTYHDHLRLCVLAEVVVRSPVLPMLYGSALEADSAIACEAKGSVPATGKKVCPWYTVSTRHARRYRGPPFRK